MLYQILALLIWSSSFVAAKHAYTMLDPVLLVQIRLLIAAALVLPVCRRHLGSIPRGQWKAVLWVVFVNYIVVLLLQLLGLSLTSAASAVAILGLEPLIMVFVGHFLFGDRARTYHWLCGAAAFTGVGLMIAGGAEEGGSISLLGCLLVLVGGTAFCFITRPTQRLIGEIGAPAYTAVSFALGSLMCLPFTLMFADIGAVRWSLSGSLSVLYLGVACSWLAYLLWNKGMGSVPANLSGLLIALEPVFGVLLAVLLLGEHLTPLSWIGIALIIGATLTAVLLPKYLSARLRQAT